MDGIAAAQKFKKAVFGGYLKALHRMDPALAQHVLAAQREVFLAGASFLNAEAGHAQKAVDRMARRASEHEKTAPPNPAPTE